MENKILVGFKKLPPKGQRIFWQVILVLTLISVILYILSLYVNDSERSLYKLFLITAGLEIFIILEILLISWIGKPEKALAFIYSIIPILFVASIFARGMVMKEDFKHLNSVLPDSNICEQYFEADDNCVCEEGYIKSGVPWLTPDGYKGMYCKVNMKWEDFKSCISQSDCEEDFVCTTESAEPIDYRCVPIDGYARDCGCDLEANCWCM